jgi:hypothetical protein
LKRNKISTGFVQQKSPTAAAEGLFDYQVEKRGGKSDKFEEDLRSIGKDLDLID